MVSIRIDLAEAKRIEREAQKILKAKMKGISVRHVKASPEARAYAKQLTAYKKKTGKRRLTYDEKKALHHFTAGQVSKRIDKGSKAYERRLKSFEKSYGPADEQSRYVLEYLTPAAAARKLERKKIEPPKNKPPKEEPPKEDPPKDEPPKDDTGDDLEEATFTEITLPGKTWNELPDEFKGWSHDSGSYMYVNNKIFWKENASMLIDMQKLFTNGADGDDHTNAAFFAAFTYDIYGSRYTYDPEGKGDHIMVLSSEWEEVEKLPDDWKETRKYFRKKK